MSTSACWFPRCGKPPVGGPMCTDHVRVTVATNGSWGDGEKPEDDS